MLEATLEVMHDRAGYTRADVEASIPFVEEGGRGEKKGKLSIFGMRNEEMKKKD